MDSLEQRHRHGQRLSRRRADSVQTIAVNSEPPREEFTTAQQHPCHQHALRRVDACVAYRAAQPPGAWHCDHCKRRSSVLKQRYPWHCTAANQTPPCQYDLCDECFYGSMHPLHAHRLQLADANVTYASENGIWSCEYCNLDRMTTKERHPYHCDQCNFDLCVRCYEGLRHPLHPHRLQPADADLVYNEHGGMWFCDMCHSSRKQLREGHMWHCVQCQFDLCVSCANGTVHVDHCHQLYLADADVAYASFAGLWSCDRCGCSRKSSGQRFMRHCAECSFDLCTACFLAGVRSSSALTGGAAGTSAMLSPLETGKLMEDTSGKLDVETAGSPHSKSGTLRVGSIGDQFDGIDFTSDPKKEAQFVDMGSACEKRMANQVEKDHRSARSARSANADEDTAASSPAKGRSHGDGKVCLLCMDQPRNATFVHGDTGHLACCMECARRVHGSGGACPVCRQPIAAVIEQFLA